MSLVHLVTSQPSGEQPLAINPDNVANVRDTGDPDRCELTTSAGFTYVMIGSYDKITTLLDGGEWVDPEPVQEDVQERGVAPPVEEGDEYAQTAT